MDQDHLQQSRHTYLFGYPLKHSLAPLLHSTIFQNLNVPWTYQLIESVDKDDFIPKLKASDCVGAAVTMPHKVAWINECDEVTEEGRAIGAINTVYIRKDPVTGERRYIGTNTDCVGVREAFLQNVPGIEKKSKGRPALVIGGGGACRSAIYALYSSLGATEIYLVNRLKEEADAVVESFSNIQDGPKMTYVSSLEQAKTLETPVLIVGTVPDFAPSTEGEILARDIGIEFLQRKEKGTVLEMCYHPNIITSFSRLAEENGWEVIPGTEAMIYQGIAQEVLWMQKPLNEMPLEAAKAAIGKALGSQ
ncbi:uncharacterized protein FIESC28_05270 [Fusarium coffeatum]|uniref:Shikimate dehydrogenase substrate binding N-terminal domain-containing protein n=1 Tax=Fusarium coffeatum TaxID=231269 RepID=A0A366RV16_9HYPO|nr:uncharacterized protein FIESC28_05270 [Fusarium coffeatum]RBR20306.1 hypothetical protein FIESC28_05270 [Fusarium coffeatum]